MRRRLTFLTLALLLTSALTPTAGLAHDSPNDGHIPKDANYGFEVVGRDTLAGVVDGNYTDVWSHNGFAYVGTFQNPCSEAGVFIVDMAAAVANYPATEGATVASIKSAPNTRINDVRVHTVGDIDVLITTQEPCGMQIPGWAQSGGTAPFQVGQGGISLYDVTDPTKPRALKKNYLEFEGVHNTFPWDWEGKSYLVGTADTFDFFDTFFVDITNPQSPRLLSVTGALDWFAAGAFDDGQFETGSSASINNHDNWVEIIDGVPTAVISYWDAGFVTLDVTDPANPVYLDDSTYVDPEPILGLPYEGNAHAAVFGGGGDYIFGGDEDFAPRTFVISYDGVSYPAGVALFGGDSETLAGAVVDTATDGCASVPEATALGQVALIDRGGCFFSTKAWNAELAGYVGFIIVNNAGDGLINMSAGTDDPITIPGVFIGQSDGAAIRSNAGLPVSASSAFDGWGYLHVINNTGGDVIVPIGGAASGNTATIPQMGELGYYAPAQAVEEINPDTGEPYGTEFGDLTMHNVEADPLTQGITPSFDEGPRMFVSWYSLGMRAVEYRPGHYHANLNNEGSYSQNIHEVGRWIEPDGGSNFWGVHVDQMEIDGENTQVILASDRNNGLYIFTFSCLTRVEVPDGEDPVDILYCDPATTTP